MFCFGLCSSCVLCKSCALRFVFLTVSSYIGILMLKVLSFFCVCFLHASCFSFEHEHGWQRPNMEKGVCLLTWTLVKHRYLFWISLQPWSWILNLWTLWVCHWMYLIKRTRVEALTDLCGSMQTSFLVPTPRALCLPLMEPGKAATLSKTSIFTNNFRSIISLVLKEYMCS